MSALSCLHSLGMTKYCTDRQTAAGKTVPLPQRPCIINLCTACSTSHDDSTRTFNQESFTDDERTTSWTKQRRNTAPTDKFKQKQLVATAPTRKLINSLHSMPYKTNRHGNSTGRNLLTAERQNVGRNNNKIPYRPRNFCGKSVPLPQRPCN